MIDKSPEKLRADSIEHLRYEIWMMQETAQRLLNDHELHKDAVLKNSAVEACVVHARSLTGFIYADNAQPDDITSDDYVLDKATWVRARGAARPPILETLHVRTNKEVAHLTTKRLSADDPAKNWPLREIVDELHALLKRFVTYAAADRLDPEVAQFITTLRRPIETSAITKYNPDSTEINTSPTPAFTLSRIDVGTTAPILPWPRST